MTVKVKNELPAAVSTSAAGSQDQPGARREGGWSWRPEQPSPLLPFTPPPPPTPRHGERRARGCAGVTQTQLDGHNTELKARGAPGGSLWSALFWILPSCTLFGAEVLRVEVGTCCTLRSVSRGPILAPDAPVTWPSPLPARSCRSHAGRVSATWRGGNTSSLGSFP